MTGPRMSVDRDPNLGLVARMPDGTVRPVTVRIRPECLPDSVVERLRAIADAHPSADVEWVGGLADEG